jgi:Tfp pilus assembly protein PilF
LFFPERFPFMANADSAAPPPSPWGRRLLWTGSALLLAAVTATAIVVWFRQPRTPDRDLVAEAIRASPFLNVDPGVGYADEATCAECHAGKATTYAQHPMGRSAAVVRTGDPIPAKPFTAAGYRFAALRRRGELIHQAQWLDGGQVVAGADRVVRYVIGSGTRGRSYLFELDGCLFQSPISWFEQSQTWDLSPGFAAFYPPEPAVVPACLFCHVNRAEPVPHTRNRYRPPIFDGLAIGCQRCHGPGELHVSARRRREPLEGPFDATIVNPRHLPPLLRDNVCEQCHLQGEKRIVRKGREPFDYRPGLPLHLFWSIFVRAPEHADHFKAVGHVEQMQASRCFQASKGKMGCATCHDPHRQPTAGEKVREFRQKCLDCHLTRPCSLPPAERHRQSAQDSCIQCHMQRFKTSNIAHTAVSDHRILRRPSTDRPSQPPSLPPSGESPIVNFFQDHLDPDDHGAQRDLALVQLLLARESAPLRSRLLGLARPLLEKAIQAGPDDVEALEAHGLALAMSGKEVDALKAWQRVLRKVPDREASLALAAQVLRRQGKRQEVLRTLRRLVEVNPANAIIRFHLAQLLGEEGEWQLAREQCEMALLINPFSADPRQQLVLCWLRSGNRKRAERELTLLLRLQPGRKEQLEAWFAEEARGGGG